MKVIKRNGRTEELDVSKIKKYTSSMQRRLVIRVELDPPVGVVQVQPRVEGVVVELR